MPGSRPLLHVVGSGPVALAFALFALRQGIDPRRIVLERREDAIPAALAARQLAVSLGSWQLLRRIASAPPAAPIATVDVSVTGHPGRTRITAAEMGVPALGYVLRYAPLLESLRKAAGEAGLFAAPADPDAAEHPRLEIHAEGDTGEDAAVLEFEQAALLAEVEVEAQQGATAWECFTPEGPLALLPLPEPRRYSLVWCAAPAESRRRAALAPEDLAAELQSAFGWQLGRVSIASPCFVAPMVRRSRRQTASEREAWIGNAAQMLHPVAGQGLNLGLRDAFLLARCLADADADGRPAGTALTRYASERRVDRQGTIALTDAFARVFTMRPLRPLQSVALSALDLAPPARAALARRLMFGHR
ncbi:MAG TPA: FAD-dependent monooxygenase [Quisquiliibacterium sp.]|nr:FAD-dependent monooxygenase [Quisquiliibacterium sp.]